MDFSNMFKGIGDFFSVGSPVTSMSDMGAPDVIKTQNALADLGYFNAEMPDVGEGLKSFQADNGLKVDGIMNPNGETENALGQALSNQGSSGMDMLEKAGKVLPNNITLNQPDTSNPDNRSWSASASFGKAPAKPKAAPKPKVDPITGLKDPLAKSLIPKKSKAEMDTLWEQVAEKQKPKAAIMPQGDSVDERLRSMMAHPEYAKKKNPQVVQYIQDEFKRAYPGNVEYDETGKMIQPKPVIQANDVRAYDLNKELETMRFQPEVQQDLNDVMTYTVSESEEKDDVLYGGSGDDDLSDDTAQTQSAQEWDNENPERIWDIQGEKWQQEKEVNPLEKRLRKEMEEGDPQKVFEEISRLKAEDPDGFNTLSENFKKAHEEYAMQNHSSEPQHLSDLNNEEKAVNKGVARAAQPYTRKAIENKSDEILENAAIGLGTAYGVSDKTLKDKASTWKKERDKNAIPEIYRGKTIATPLGELAKHFPGIDNAITAKEYAEIAENAGFGEKGRQGAAIVGLFTGKLGKVASKYGAKGVNAIVKAFTGKELSTVTPQIAAEIRDQLVEQSIDAGLRKVIEGALP